MYNHLGPGDLDLWQLDGWFENGLGVIYLYNDDRSHTPWGETRPSFGCGELAPIHLRQRVFMWLGEYHVDGLRYDFIQFIRSVDGSLDNDPRVWGTGVPVSARSGTPTSCTRSARR